MYGLWLLHNLVCGMCTYTVFFYYTSELYSMDLRTKLLITKIKLHRYIIEYYMINIGVITFLNSIGFVQNFVPTSKYNFVVHKLINYLEYHMQ